MSARLSGRDKPYPYNSSTHELRISISEILLRYEPNIPPHAYGEGTREGKRALLFLKQLEIVLLDTFHIVVHNTDPFEDQQERVITVGHQTLRLL